MKLGGPCEMKTSEQGRSRTCVRQDDKHSEMAVLWVFWNIQKRPPSICYNRELDGFKVLTPASPHFTPRAFGMKKQDPTTYFSQKAKEDSGQDDSLRVTWQKGQLAINQGTDADATFSLSATKFRPLSTSHPLPPTRSGPSTPSPGGWKLPAHRAPVFPKATCGSCLLREAEHNSHSLTVGGLLLPPVGKQCGRDRKERAVPCRDLTVTAPGRAEGRESSRGCWGGNLLLLSSFQKTKTNLTQILGKIMRER